MSIINDALKKVSEQNKKMTDAKNDGQGPADYGGFEYKNKADQTPEANKGKTLKNLQTKKTPVLLLALLTIAAILYLAYNFLYLPSKKNKEKGAVPAKAESVRTVGAGAKTGTGNNPEAKDKAADSSKGSQQGAENQAEQIVPPALDLNGIVYDETKPYTVINNKILVEGDSTEGVTIIKIQKGSVRYLFKGKEFELKAK